VESKVPGAMRALSEKPRKKRAGREYCKFHQRKKDPWDSNHGVVVRNLFHFA
jgi:hypothetical protein